MPTVRQTFDCRACIGGLVTLPAVPKLDGSTLPEGTAMCVQCGGELVLIREYAVAANVAGAEA